MTINVLQYLEESTSQYPNKVVFADPNSQITYKELQNQAKTIGSQLSTILTGQIRKPIAVFINREISSLISFLGVCYSGNFYVPIDGQFPPDRIKKMINTLQPEAIIVTHNDKYSLPEIDYSGQILVFEELLNSPTNEQILAEIKKQIIDTDPLYVIFTSGSTGTPKGVVVCHRSVIDLIERFTELFGFSDKDIFGNQAPFDFDVSVKDIYSTLKNGATMHIIPKVLFSFPGRLIDFLNQWQITTAIWSTSALRIVANFKALEKDVPRYLNKIMFSGEVMPNKVLNYWRNRVPHATYVNLYGPTEITCNCTYFIVERPFSDNESLPIGVPFPNTDILLLNENNQPVDEDEIGEICVRGTSLALGYYNNPTESMKAFCQNPLNPHYSEIIYRTGDLGKYNYLGELMFLSRKDYQIKHMGHRIELGEIEVAVNALEFIDVGCCIYDEENEKIVLFYQSEQECNKDILVELRRHLPKYMLPNRLVHSKKLPLNKNAKIDRIKLKREYIDGNRK